MGTGRSQRHLREFYGVDSAGESDGPIVPPGPLQLLPGVLSDIYAANETYFAVMHPDNPSAVLYTDTSGVTLSVADGDPVGYATDPFGMVYPGYTHINPAQRPILRIAPNGSKSVEVGTAFSRGFEPYLNYGYNFPHTNPVDFVLAGYITSDTPNLWYTGSLMLSYDGTKFRMYHGDKGYFHQATVAANQFLIVHWNVAAGLSVYDQTGALIATGTDPGNPASIINWGNVSAIGGGSGGLTSRLVFAFDSSTFFVRPGLSPGRISAMVAAIANDYAGWTL